MLTRDIVVIGASAGGVQALMQLVSWLPSSFPAAVFVVQHTLPDAKSLLPAILTRNGNLPAAQATEGEAIVPGRIYVAPPDRHLLLEDGSMRLWHGPKENHSRPSIDVLFRTAAETYGARVVGVVLTGSLYDGTAGLIAIKRCGGVAIVQDPAEALFPSMPRSAISKDHPDYILPLSDIADTLQRLATDCSDLTPPAATSR